MQANAAAAPDRRQDAHTYTLCPIKKVFQKYDLGSLRKSRKGKLRLLPRLAFHLYTS